MDHHGYLELVRTSLVCYFSVLSSSHVDDTVSAVCGKMLMRLLGPYVVMAVPMQVLVCMVEVLVYPCDGCSIVF